MPGLPKGSSYRFGEFTLSPARRLLLKGRNSVPLIPKYFDLLCLLVERRAEALGRQAIFDAIWPDVIVSESSLTQAIRTLRRALNDSPKTPRYIRTVSRHGYQFIFDPVDYEADVAPQPDVVVPRPAAEAMEMPVELLLDRVLGSGEFAALQDEERRDAAAALHAVSTAQALAGIAGRTGAEHARALLRETRWDVPDAGEVPILTAPGRVRTVRALVSLRMRDAATAAAERLGTAAAGGAIAGVIGGALGGLALYLPADSRATPSTVSALMIIGGVAGMFGAGVIGAGLASAEVLARSRRRTALVTCGTLSGLLAGLAAKVAVVTVFGSILGRPPLALGGPLEGGIVGFAAGIGYAVSSYAPRGGGMATPRGAKRLKVGLVTAISCGLLTAALGGIGASTVSVTLDSLSLTYDGSQLGLAPLAPFLGERDSGPLTRAAASGFEGLLFGFGLAFGLTHRPSGVNSR